MANHIEDVSTTEVHCDIMVQIFLKLPIKSIIRFKSVCRAWNDLFSSQTFIQRHCETVKSSLEKTHKLTLLVHVPQWRLNRKIDHKNEIFSLLVEHSDGKPVIEERLNIPIEDISAQIEVIGCINGLVCLARYGGGSLYMLWNPATRKLSCIPKSPTSAAPVRNLMNSYLPAGFAYDRTTNSYMIIRIVFHRKSLEPMVEIYSTRTSSWTTKKVEGIPSADATYFEEGVIGGAPVPRWIVYSFEESVYKLICFDASTEDIRVYDVDAQKEFSELASVGEDLALVDVCKTRANIGKLIKDGNGRDSSYHIEKSTLELGGIRFNKMVGFGRDGEIIVQGIDEGWDTLVLHDLKEGKHKLLTNHAKGYAWIYHYTHSLVWPSTLLV